MKPRTQVETYLDFAIQPLDPDAGEALLIGKVVESLHAVITSSG